jgi:hypothetical protein
MAWAVLLLVLASLPASAGEAARIPFGQYQANQKYIATGRPHGWTTRFHDGAPEENGRIAEHGFLRGEIFRPTGPGAFSFVILMHGCGGMDAIARKMGSDLVSLSQRLECRRLGLG